MSAWVSVTADCCHAAAAKAISTPACSFDADLCPLLSNGPASWAGLARVRQGREGAWCHVADPVRCVELPKLYLSLRSAVHMEEGVFCSHTIGLVGAHACCSAHASGARLTRSPREEGPCDVPLAVLGGQGTPYRVYYRVECKAEEPARSGGRRNLIVDLEATTLWRLWYRWSRLQPRRMSLSPSANETAVWRSRFARDVLTRATVWVRDRLEGGVYAAPPSFYALARACHDCRIELYASSLDESGVMDAFCSADPGHKAFGSVGTWQCCEETIEAGAANPPFNRGVLLGMLAAFDEGVVRSKPYFGLAIVPASLAAGGLLPTTFGEVLLPIPGGCLPFRSKDALLQASRRCTPQPNWKMRILVVVWVNRAYLLAHLAPVDVEDAYMAWAALCMENQDRVHCEVSAMRRALPSELRGGDARAHLFSEAYIRRVNESATEALCGDGLL